MAECEVCREKHSGEVEIVQLQCGCEVCKTALVDWIQVQIDLGYRDIVCTGAGRHIVNPSELDRLLPVAVLRRLVYRDVVKALCHVEVKRCPNQQCGCMGWTDAPIFCLSEYECGNCGQKWRDETVVRWFDIPTVVAEFLSELWKSLLTSSCPSCLFPIQKAGGCPHMTCARCSYEFCWICSQSYITHSVSKCSRVTASKYGPMGILTCLFWVKCLVTMLPALLSYILSIDMYPYLVVLIAYISIWIWIAAATGVVSLYQRHRAVTIGLFPFIFVPLVKETYWVLLQFGDVFPQLLKVVLTLLVAYLPLCISWLTYSHFH